MSEKDSSTVTGQPAPPTPDEFATDWLIVDFDAAARTAMDWATNPRVSAKLELLRGHIFAIAQTYHEQMRGDYRKHPEAAAQPLTPPQPPRWTAEMVEKFVHRHTIFMQQGSYSRTTTWPFMQFDKMAAELNEKAQAAPPSLTPPSVEKLADVLREIDYMNWSAGELAKRLLSRLGLTF